MKKNENRMFAFIMSKVTEITLLAHRYGLSARYIPVIGAIEIIDNGIPIGISYDGYRLKLFTTKQKVNLYQFMSAYAKTGFVELLPLHNAEPLCV